MQSLVKKLNILAEQIEAAFSSLEIHKKQDRIDDLTRELADSSVWNNPTQAQAKSKQLAALAGVVGPWVTLRVQVSDMLELIEIGDDSLEKEFDQQIGALEEEYTKLRKDLQFKDKYDSYNVILRLSAGVGGTDAQDWTEMLERMYLRWAEKENMKTSVVERSSGEEAGIKSCVIEIDGPFAYGKLQSENGVHRLVRLSPYNSDNLRQTSFALVEVLPQIEASDEVNISEKDLKIDVYRSGGKGGQSVNTTDSAVRITHIPTGIVTAIQNERSQLQNREMAMKILRSKLVKLQLEQSAASIADLHAGESASWGSQIRNYVLHPYTMVKDTRTKHEEVNVQNVLDGDINGFIEAFLNS